MTPARPSNFAITGVGGVIAPRHLRAIRDVDGRILGAADPRDSVGILDDFGFDIPFFTELERLDRHLEKLRHGPDDARVHYLTVCSPNYLHDSHCRLGLRLGADVICEKPIVISPWNLDPLKELEAETGHRVWTVLQLRAHERLASLRDELARASSAHQHDVVLTYVTPRGRWYDVSWKGNVEKSGGIATNIGVHMFDLLVWLFGPPVRHGVHHHEARRMAGFLELERARVSWFLSVEERDVPVRRDGAPTTFRSITIDGSEIEFSSGFSDLHTRVYETILAGRGFGIDDARPSIELAYRLRTAEVQAPKELVHPLLRR